MENVTKMSDTELALAHHSWFGFSASLIGFVTSFLTAVTPILQVLVLVVSLAIGVLTIEAKLKERKLKKNNGKK
jgi:preprotein translocase subunit SecG